MKIERFKDGLSKYPIISVEFREYKHIDRITILRYSYENKYTFPDDVKIYYGVSVEVLISNIPKKYDTQEIFLNDYKNASDLYTYFFKKIKR